MILYTEYEEIIIGNGKMLHELTEELELITAKWNADYKDIRITLDDNVIRLEYDVQA